jgi:hypothetical protein
VNRFYWKVMSYACDRCAQRTEFYLEEGCEGPRNGPVEKFVPRVGPLAGQEVEWHRTASGRLVLPVPFIAYGCPVCQPRPPWSMKRGAGVVSHFDWRKDRELMVREVPRGAAAFWYPKTPRADQACGVPISPAELEAGVVRPSVRDLVAL